MESDVLEEMYELYANDIFRYARYSIGNREDAMDIVQEVFIKAQRSLDEFRGQSSPKTWLMTIARRTIADYFRTKKREKIGLDNVMNELPVPTDSTCAAADRLDLEHALAQLNDRDRQVFVMRYVLGFSLKETAAVLGWSDVRVRVNHHRTLRKLRGLLNVAEDEGGAAHANLN